MAISGFVAAWAVVSVGFSLSMVLNVPNQTQSMQLMLLLVISGTKISTFTSTVRLEDTVRGLAKEPCELDWRWETAVMVTKAVLMPTLGSSPPAASSLRRYHHPSSYRTTGCLHKAADHEEAIECSEEYGCLSLVCFLLAHYNMTGKVK